MPEDGSAFKNWRRSWNRVALWVTYQDRMHPRASRAARVMNLRRPECEEQRARLLQSEREEAYGRAFDALIGEQSVLEGLYAPLMARLGAAWAFLGTVRGALTQP